MPKIPTYDSPQVKSQSLPNAFIKTGGVNPGAFGAEQGEQLQQTGKILNVVGDNIEKAREQKAISDGMDAANSLQERSLKKQQELQNRAGKDAVGIQKEFETWHAEQQAELAGGLKDPDAQVLFNRNAQKIRLRDQDWAGGYEKKQGDIYHEVTMKTGIENAQSAALMNPTRDNVSSSVNEIRSYYGELAHRKGFDADWVAANTREAEQKIHKDVLSNAMDQDAVGSVQSYINEFGDSLDPGVRGKAEKWVHNKVIDETAGAYADTLIGSGVSYSEALAGVREKFSGEDEDKYVRKVKERFGEVEQMKRMQSDEIQDSFYKQLAQHGDVTKIPDKDLEALTEADPKAGYMLKKQKDAALDVKAKGGEFADESDIETAKHLDDKILNGDIKDPNELKAYRGTLTQSDYNSYQNAIEKQGLLSSTNAVAAYKDYLPAEKKKKGYVETMDDRAREAQFIKDAADYVKETHRPQDLNAFAANWHLQGKVEGSGWFGTNFKADKMALGDAVAQGKADKFAPIKPLEDNALTHDYLNRGAEKQVVKTGMANGRKVVQYSDGSIEYAQ